MKKGLIALMATMGALMVMPVKADTMALTTCFVDSLNGKERKQLATWIYFAVAAHPEMKPFSNISPQQREAIDKKVGALVTRLLVEDCEQEFIVAQKRDPLAVEAAFEMVGKVAMQELMNSEDVTQSITNYVKYTDQKAISKLFNQ
ncbi:hypothetical protein [Vibrio taketomensis]|uniref:hypothetical protein n=1 Tax=Vibrio taketomensis TaxID=2572923 RepID=UPI001389C249|nr:hypothetical protein [Vibrio taketomensis]